MKKIILLLSLVFVGLTSINAQQNRLIGIADTYNNGETTVPRAYIDAVLKVGNIPVLIPFMQDEDHLAKLIGTLDAVILPGGEDINPARYHELPSPKLGEVNLPRDSFDMAVIKLSVKEHVPLVGICRGMQAINVYFGGTLYQDLPSEYAVKNVAHRQTLPKAIATHTIYVTPESYLARISGQDSLRVNSFHHQAVKDVAPGFKVTARATDGVIEAFESDKYGIIAVQFHPEGLVIGNDSAMIEFFRSMPVKH
ncbi:gamma-glutamyl-gamma-aminobutyrate hydrolase family protein [uncultured Bacteroides sp.]|uniref:gamma-glutamyl-gamma-aminobutyrate hydrolase family protein n=1 Tax=uncultured Bacteroides sp. TaxID=162156 RepID=UPI002AA70DAF|nr:gamma-glutamyl-gamma-aminobutyrate hydrolase family protein [uncultured Bacteroides sp.]